MRSSPPTGVVRPAGVSVQDVDLGQRHDAPARQRRVPVAAKRKAASALTTAARDDSLSIPIGGPLALDRIVEAHDHVDAGKRERLLISLP